MKNKIIVSSLVLSLACISCVSRAPSTYQLDKQAGLAPQNEDAEPDVKLADIFPIQGLFKEAKEPTRSAPSVEKVWVYDQENEDGSFLQGTYLYFQMDDGHWVNPGDASI